MKRLRLHIVRGRDVAKVPPLELDGTSLEQWFADAAGGLLQLDRVDGSCSRVTDECDGGLLDEILRAEIAYPEKRPVDDIALMFCRRWALPSGAGDLKIFGLMFDFKDVDPVLGQFYSGGVPREAGVVFLDAFGDGDDDKIVFTAIHELGHVFNFTHDTGGPSFMSPRGWDARHFSGGDQESLTFAAQGRYPYDWTCLPGGAEFQEGSPARATLVAVDPGLRLRARLPKERYVLGEPVVLDVALETDRARPASIRSILDPGHAACRIWIETPRGERRRHHPPFYFCRTLPGMNVVSKRAPMEHNPRLTVGRRGLNFTIPGEYRVWMECDVTWQRRKIVVTSTTVEFEVALPRTEVEEAVSRTLCEPSAAYFVAHKGGGLARAGKRRLEQLADAFPNNGAVQHVRYALGMYHLKRGRRAAAKRILRGVKPHEESLRRGLDVIREQL